MNPIEQKLASLNIRLAAPSLAIANYLPFTLFENMVFISGQLPLKDGQLIYKGKIGRELSLEDGQAAAYQCAVNILAHLRGACNGDLSRVRKCLRLGGFVNCTSDFTQQPQVINGASDLMVDIFGDNGRHARAAVGVNALPLGAAVEIEGTFLIE